MAQEKVYKSREEVARIDLGSTKVSPFLQRFLSVSFILILFIVPIVDLSNQVFLSKDSKSTSRISPVGLLPSRIEVSGSDEDLGWFDSLININNGIIEHIGRLETQVEEGSVLGDKSQLWIHRLIIGELGGATGSVYVGQEPWLFYRPALEFIWGDGFLDRKFMENRKLMGAASGKTVQPDPRLAVLEFKEQLDSLGIQLVLVPAPSKAEVYPEQFSGRMSSDVRVANRDFDSFLFQMEEAGVIVVDLADAFMTAKHDALEPLYLERDTHWSPSGLALAASTIKKVLVNQGMAVPEGERRFTRERKHLSNEGDLAKMLKLGPAHSLGASEEVVGSPVVTIDGHPWESKAESEILLLGDSFSNIFQSADMGWGSHAGLASQLSYELQKDLDTIIINDNGSFATRTELVRSLAGGEPILHGKKWVIWEFASRELSLGNWQTGFTLDYATDVGELNEMSTENVRVEGEVIAVAKPPDAGSAPYADCVIAVHCRIRNSDGGTLAGQDILVFTLGMKAFEWLTPAYWQPGEVINLDLIPWSDVESDFGSFNRAEIFSRETLFLPIYWYGHSDRDASVPQ